MVNEIEQEEGKNYFLKSTQEIELLILYYQCYRKDQSVEMIFEHFENIVQSVKLNERAVSSLNHRIILA